MVNYIAQLYYNIRRPMNIVVAVEIVESRVIVVDIHAIVEVSILVRVLRSW